MSLSVSLREETAQAHTDAERSGFVRMFMKGGLDRPAYRNYLAAMRAIYVALEAGIIAGKEAHAALPALYFPELIRVPAIEEDMRFFETPTDLSPPAAATAYAEHLGQIAREQPVLLAAHAYVRYLGDLSGGQMLAKAVTRTFTLNENEGIAFYRFDEIPDLTAFKNVYRAALDNLAVSDEERSAIVEEAKLSFALNGRVFEDLTPENMASSTDAAHS
jgi:heme oxygenase